MSRYNRRGRRYDRPWWRWTPEEKERYKKWQAKGQTRKRWELYPDWYKEDYEALVKMSPPEREQYLDELNKKIEILECKWKDSEEEYNHLSNRLSELESRLESRREELRKAEFQTLKAEYERIGWLSKLLAPPFEEWLSSRRKAPGPFDREHPELVALCAQMSELRVKKIDPEINREDLRVHRSLRQRLHKMLKTSREEEQERQRQIKEARRQERMEAVAEAHRKRIEAQAAAYFDRTKKLGYKVRGALLDQLQEYPDCPYCGGPLGDDFEADHIYPASRGGLSTPDNMVLVCVTCNNKKSDKTLREFIVQEGLDRERIEQVIQKLGKTF